MTLAYVRLYRQVEEEGCDTVVPNTVYEAIPNKVARKLSKSELKERTKNKATFPVSNRFPSKTNEGPSNLI